MTFESSVAFAVAVLVFAATPGPAIFACLSEAIGSGLRSALALSLGIVFGDVLFLLLAIYGLTVIATVLGGLFMVVKVLGGAYLVWLGWRLWTRPVDQLKVGEASRRPTWQNFGAGLLITLGNPKVVLFYLGFVPAFVDLSALRGGDVAVLSILLATVLLGVNATYAVAGARLSAFTTDARTRRRLNRCAGSVLIATGAYVATRG